MKKAKNYITKGRLRFSYVIILLLSAVMIFGTSCRKHDLALHPDSHIPNSQITRELQVPGNFNWNTTRPVHATITVNARPGSELFSVVHLFKSDPGSGGEPVTAGTAGFGYPFEADLLLPNHVKGVWMKVFYPDGETETVLQPISHDRINYIFNQAGQGTGGNGPFDTDLDGVPDTADEYPTDPTRAFNNYFPSTSGWSTFAFEDLWPFFGDFDMNDLVVNVRFNRVTNAQNNVVDLVNTYLIRAVGGSFRNGFAFSLDHLDPSVIQSVTGSVISSGSYLSIAPNGTEAGTTVPVVVLWDDAETLINRTKGSFFNTEVKYPSGHSDPHNISVHFRNPLSRNDVGLPPYNHFLIRNKDRGHEIHLPNHKPTSKANTNLFGTGNDDTTPSLVKFYKSENNLPWAIFIGEHFDYPIERADVIHAHLKFAEWAQSGGSIFYNWYHDLPGYRNDSLIYNP